MTRPIHSDLLTAQISGYPTGGYKPAISCVFNKGAFWTGTGSGDLAATYDYSFDPTPGVSNRMLMFVREERPYGPISPVSSAVMRLRNEDHAVPDITGYYVDIYKGLQTSSGIKYAGASAPWTPLQRYWVYSVNNISMPGERVVDLELWDIWRILGATMPNGTPCFPVALGSSPHFQADNGDGVPGSLFTGMTIYEILDYVINYLQSALGYAFSLDPLGTADDGLISKVVPIASDDAENPGQSIIYPNRNEAYQTAASFIADMMSYTHCRVRARDGLAFKVIYPQESDAPNEKYSSNGVDAEGNACMTFYEAHDKKTLLVPNVLRVYGNENDNANPGTFVWGASGDAYGSEDFTTYPTYNGRFMRMPAYFKSEGIGTDAEAESLADTMRNNSMSETQSGRLTIPHDCRVELYDMVSVKDNR